MAVKGSVFDAYEKSDLFPPKGIFEILTHGEVAVE